MRRADEVVADLWASLPKMMRDYNSPQSALMDYGVGFGVGAGGQQLLNATTDGADPNALISGLIGAPINRLGMQAARLTAPSFFYQAGKAGSRMKNPLEPTREEAAQVFTDTGATVLNQLMRDRPIELGLGTAAMLGAVPTGAATSIYNVATDGTDYDNNLTSAIGGLVALAPITYSIMTRRGNK